MMDYSNAQWRADKLTVLPLFSTISPEWLIHLASYFRAVSFKPGQAIVLEGEPVDSVYLILTGEAAVTKQGVVLATLRQDEAIGLSETGLYATEGVRTATVTAITSVLALRMTLSEFLYFLSQHPGWSPALHGATEKVAKLGFIKQIEPFAEIDPSILEDVIRHIDDKIVPAGTILFREGDAADGCYLLQEGTVNILVQRPHQQESDVVAELSAGTLFGELALLTEGCRNATAQAVTECKVLMLDKHQFKHLMQHSPHAYEILTTMMMDRYRPIQSPGVTIHERHDAEKNKIVILKNAVQGSYFKTTEQGLFVWHKLDGYHTIQDIAIEYFYQYHRLATDDIGQLIINLMQAGFVQAPKLASYIKRPSPPRWISLLLKLKHVLEFEYSFHHVDQWVSAWYQRLGRYFYTAFAKTCMAAVSVIGLLFFIAFYSHVGPVLQQLPHAWLLLVLVVPATAFIVPLHELAHAMTAKAYGREVHRFGVGWFWLGPMAFADTSDMWLSGRGARTAVNLAGIVVNFTVSGLLAILAWYLPFPTVAVFLWLVAFSSYLMAIYNMDPSFELDGYYVLMDAFDRPNLRYRAVDWLMRQRTWQRDAVPEMAYWISCIMFIALTFFLAYLVQVAVLQYVFPVLAAKQHDYIHWLFPSVILIISLLSLYLKIRQQKPI